jgi:hypothetical protein
MTYDRVPSGSRGTIPLERFGARRGKRGRNFPVDVLPKRRDNFIEGGMTALPSAMATRNRVLTTAKALARALRQAESDRPAPDSAPFSFPAPSDIPPQE